jgi:hypothetical protein
VDALGIREIADDLAIVLIDNHHVVPARKVNAMGIGIHPYVVPAAFATHRHSPDYFVA